MNSYGMKPYPAGESISPELKTTGMKDGRIGIIEWVTSIRTMLITMAPGPIQDIVIMLKCSMENGLVPLGMMPFKLNVSEMGFASETNTQAGKSTTWTDMIIPTETSMEIVSD